MTTDPLQLPETGEDPIEAAKDAAWRAGLAYSRRVDSDPLIDDDRSAVIVLAVACGISGTIIALVLLAMRGLL